MSAPPEQASPEQHLMHLQARLLEAIACGDWNEYTELCSPELTCFEPECDGHLVDGLDFHKYYFELAAHKKSTAPPPQQPMMARPAPPPQTTVLNTRIKMFGDNGALVTYNRLIQVHDDQTKKPTTLISMETRIWERQPGNRWMNVHFHRSFQGKS
uniref:Calcium/calmodulin-dependent protein kinase II association-domain domain-containing protein n=1 Tax=Chromera velia CCMP2878 TaxID=1169474 RepID=A0A0G4FHS5_9ALVE|mmetsp:Transcript_44233/g.87263  ORF Transcript_44233/g.87263 Transcript_44233/m.87263 type:complete len:156 (+) Transcript_44233:217-684(+)|eukprot:Cvel_17063.t1-p1 / transcript=Cvel_17063.t1 / gene=Cvel_17063 / organism=Chromera_velia_CCMP2878 / gene_product=Calcium/calmodulin-dependent protein kinase type II, putative / transcript_product=Calcium/calmodulin-dependent protein kinase type II, putative / location=Cvel_scaffold1344:41832-44761(+) / protein_length=155 / sequence_SO=supercontig / SO=protein_coding / is_pseudo=false